MPPEKPRTTPKDFFLWAGAMAALYVGVFNYIALVWDYLNYSMPDPLSYYYGDPYQGGISWEMATLIVLAPAFLVLMFLIRRGILRDPTRREVWVRRWALFLTLFFAGATIVVDLIYVLYAFLNGTDLTNRFLLKALVVLLVAALGFMHFLADLRGYWETFPGRSRAVACGVALLVVVTVVAGFFIVGTPGQARLARLDERRVSDLQSIQSQVVQYFQNNRKLPASLANIADSVSYFSVPTDPQTGAAYAYRPTGANAFTLCAVFSAASRAQSSVRAAPVYGNTDKWDHGAGQACFDRTIDPRLYPPTTPKGVEGAAAN